MRHSRLHLSSLLFVFVASLASGCLDGIDAEPNDNLDLEARAATPGDRISLHTALGLPSRASTSSRNDHLSVKSHYVISYNGKRKVPNWVSWRLDDSDLGSEDRKEDFREDDSLPARIPQATLDDYRGSGFDRGHMCPSADRTTTEEANSETFLLTNMVPQAANNNRGPWQDLESFSRTLVKNGKQLFVVAGPVFQGTAETIGDGVEVPDQTFKVVVVLEDGQGADDVTTSTRVIGVLMPNDNSQVRQSDDWEQFRVPVRTIEQLTRLNFLSDVDPRVQDAVETRTDSL